MIFASPMSSTMLLLGDAIDEFFISQIDNARATQHWYLKRLSVLSSLRGVCLAEVSASHLRDIWAKLVGRCDRWVTGRRPPASGGLSPFTLDGYYRAWRTFFNWCVEQEYLERSPVRKLKRPALPDKSPKAITESDLIKLLGAAKQKRDYALLVFLAVTGCRVGGLAGLRMADVDLAAGLAWVTEKGRGGGKRRVVYLHGPALEALRSYLSDCRRDPDDPVFISGTGGRLTENGVRQLLRRLARRAGVRGCCNPHSLRHRFARSLLENGCDLGAVSQLMGHQDPQITISSYGRWTHTELKSKHRRFARLPGYLPE
jgi:integrase